MKPITNEKTCSNSAIGLEIEGATCVGDASKSGAKQSRRWGRIRPKRAGTARDNEAPTLEATRTLKVEQ